MTITAIEAAPRRPAPLPQPTAAEVLTLQAVHARSASGFAWCN